MVKKYIRKMTNAGRGLKVKRFPAFKRRLYRQITSPNKVYTFQTYIADTVLTQTNVDTFGGFYNTIGFVDQIATYATLFDQYRIDYVEVTFRPMYTATGLTGAVTAGTVAPLIYVVKDFDDGNAPTTIAQLREYNNCKIRDDKCHFKISYKPSVLIGAETSALSLTGVSNVTSPWLDIAQTNIPHYGHKIGMLAGTAGNYQKWYMSQRIIFSMRNLR